MALPTQYMRIDPGMPIVAVTGANAGSVAPRLNGSGISHIFYKPFKADDLKNVINAVRRDSVVCN